MSLEKALQENTEASIALTKAIEALTNSRVVDVAGNAAKVTSKKETTAAPKGGDKDGGPGEDAGEDGNEGEGEITLKDCQEKLKELVAVSGKEAAKKMLDKFKVKKLPALDAEKYPELMAAVDKHLKKAADK